MVRNDVQLDCKGKSGKDGKYKILNSLALLFFFFSLALLLWEMNNWKILKVKTMMWYDLYFWKAISDTGVKGSLG